MRVKPSLDGNIVMELLELTPGPEVGKAMYWLQDLVDEYATQGEDLLPEAAVELLVRDYRLVAQAQELNLY